MPSPMSDEERPGTQPPEGGDGALAGTSSAVDDDARRKRLSELQEVRLAPMGSQ